MLVVSLETMTTTILGKRTGDSSWLLAVSLIATVARAGNQEGRYGGLVHNLMSFMQC